MAEGRLVPDDITTQIIDKRINSPEAENGFVLDGFPRNVAQAEALSKILRARNDGLSLVINLVVPEEETGREGKDQESLFRLRQALQHQT